MRHVHARHAGLECRLPWISICVASFSIDLKEIVQSQLAFTVIQDSSRRSPSWDDPAQAVGRNDLCFQRHCRILFQSLA